MDDTLCQQRPDMPLREIRICALFLLITHNRPGDFSMLVETNTGKLLSAEDICFRAGQSRFKAKLLSADDVQAASDTLRDLESKLFISRTPKKPKRQYTQSSLDDLRREIIRGSDRRAHVLWIFDSAGRPLNRDQIIQRIHATPSNLDWKKIAMRVIKIGAAIGILYGAYHLYSKYKTPSKESKDVGDNVRGHENPKDLITECRDEVIRMIQSSAKAYEIESKIIDMMSGMDKNQKKGLQTLLMNDPNFKKWHDVHFPDISSSTSSASHTPDASLSSS